VENRPVFPSDIMSDMVGKIVFVHPVGKDVNDRDSYYKGELLTVANYAVVLKDYHGEGKHLYIPMSAVESIMPA
jgi:hypothetical protein